MFVDRGFDGRFLQGQFEISGAARLEQGLTKPGANGPIPHQVINISGGDAAL